MSKNKDVFGRSYQMVLRSIYYFFIFKFGFVIVWRLESCLYCADRNRFEYKLYQLLFLAAVILVLQEFSTLSVSSLKSNIPMKYNKWLQSQSFKIPFHLGPFQIIKTIKFLISLYNKIKNLSLYLFLTSSCFFFHNRIKYFISRWRTVSAEFHWLLVCVMSRMLKSFRRTFRCNRL